jgi:hypothetical protein
MRKFGKLIIKLMFFWSLTGITVSGAGNELSKYFRTDSAHVYSWNSVESSWIPGSVQMYGYNNGRITYLLTLDYTTRAEKNKTEYLYNQAGLLENEVNYYFDGAWKESTRNVYYYDGQNRVSEIHIQKWINSAWVDDRIQSNYIYDEYGRQTEFQASYWRNNAWTSPTTDYSYYDQEGNLIRRVAIYFTGGTDYRIIYTYNQSDVLAEAYSQYPGVTGWQNWWLVNYQYDDCRFKISQVQYTGSGTEWLPGTKVVNYSYFRPELYPYPNVPVCHNGMTMYVIKKVLKRHLAHGDCLGSCFETKKSLSDPKGVTTGTPSQIPFTVYPNPASERITVVRNGYDAEIFKVDIMDMNGNLLRSQTVSDSGEVTIERGRLISGQYIVRIHGEQIYNLIVVFN